jgi:hypothetical protein
MFFYYFLNWERATLLDYQNLHFFSVPEKLRSYIKEDKKVYEIGSLKYKFYNKKILKR